MFTLITNAVNYLSGKLFICFLAFFTVVFFLSFFLLKDIPLSSPLFFFFHFFLSFISLKLGEYSTSYRLEGVSVFGMSLYYQVYA